MGNLGEFRPVGAACPLAGALRVQVVFFRAAQGVRPAPDRIRPHHIGAPPRHLACPQARQSGVDIRFDRQGFVLLAEGLPDRSRGRQADLAPDRVSPRKDRTRCF